jgi:hypothetical protein
MNSNNIFHFVNEEAKSDYGYPREYKPKSISEQAKILRKLVLGVQSIDERVSRQSLPPGAEGWFAILKWQLFSANYGRAIEFILSLLGQAYGNLDHGYGASDFSKEKFRIQGNTRESLGRLCEQQPASHILVVPCQFGKFHAGHSVRRALEIMPDFEFGLDPFSVACMMLTHPERLYPCTNLLQIDCPGAEFSHCYNDNTLWTYAPQFDCEHEKLKFEKTFFGMPSACYGSASGFLT